MITCDQLRFTYPGESFVLELERLEIASGESVAITGPSGCGKTTLLRLIAGLLEPQRGQIRVDDTRIHELAPNARSDFRLKSMGLVFQEFELLDYLTVRENVQVPFHLSGSRPEPAASLLERAGIAGLANRYPDEISQGERQRVAICRALVTRPHLILADEPTGNLDPGNKGRLTKLLREAASEANATLLMVTHDVGNVVEFDREIRLGDMLKGGPG